MKRIVYTMLLLYMSAHAGLLDFIDRHNAYAAYKNGEYHKSIAILNLLDKIPQDWYNLGNCYYKEGKYFEAVKAYEKAQNNVNKYYNLGNSYFKIQDFDNAVKSYEQALKIQKDQDAQYNLELAKTQQNKNRQEANKQNKKRYNKQSNIEQKQLKCIIGKPENKKMPTMMYEIYPAKRSRSDAKPW